MGHSNLICGLLRDKADLPEPCREGSRERGSGVPLDRFLQHQWYLFWQTYFQHFCNHKLTILEVRWQRYLLERESSGTKV